MHPDELESYDWQLWRWHHERERPWDDIERRYFEELDEASTCDTTGRLLDTRLRNIHSRLHPRYR